MSSYLFQDARIGDVVRFDGHQLEVREQRGRCPQCFFHGRICSGIACTGYEREEGCSVYYKEIKKSKHELNGTQRHKDAKELRTKIKTL